MLKCRKGSRLSQHSPLPRIMSILHTLRKHNLVLQLERVGLPSQRIPGQINGHLRVRLVDESVTPHQVHEHHIEGSSVPDSLSRIVFLAMRAVLPRHPALAAWRAQEGLEPMDIADHAIEYCGEALHTAMRKQCISPQSGIQWRAVRHLHPQDWADLLEKTRGCLRELKAAAREFRPIRREVGMALKELWTRAPQEMEADSSRSRTELQVFALFALGQACAGTDDDEFVWGWTQYLN